MIFFSRSARGVSTRLARFGHPASAYRPYRPATSLRAAAGLSAILLLPALVACTSRVAPDGTAAAPVPTVAPPAPPAVAHATDLSVAPTIAAGEGEPPDELVVRDLVVGTGAAATASSTVFLHYVGALWRDGKTFGSSRVVGAGQPLSLSLDEAIPGFARGLDGMKVGGRRELVIPPQLGYGPQANRPSTIKADDTLVFVVDLIKIEGDGADGSSGTPEK